MEKGSEVKAKGGQRGMKREGRGSDVERRIKETEDKER